MVPRGHQCGSERAPVWLRGGTSVVPRGHQCGSEGAPVGLRGGTSGAPGGHQWGSEGAPVGLRGGTSVAPRGHQWGSEGASVWLLQMLGSTERIVEAAKNGRNSNHFGDEGELTDGRTGLSVIGVASLGGGPPQKCTAYQCMHAGEGHLWPLLILGLAWPCCLKLSFKSQH